MNETPKTKPGWRILRRILMSLAILATLVAILYAEEDWRGKRAWENCKRELEAKGEVLDWDKYIPPPVPDDQNFFKATTNIVPWFVKARTTNEMDLAKRLSLFRGLFNTKTTGTIKTESAALDYLAWSDQFQSEFDEVREALKRPYARMDGDYSKPYEQPIPNFITVRGVAQVLAQRAKCDLLLGQPDKALQEVTLMRDMCRLLEAAPTGKPVTLVAAMINVAVAGLYVDTIANGFQKQAWQEPQLTTLQRQLEQINLLPIVAQSFASEPAATTHTLEIVPMPKLKEWFSSGNKSSLWQRMKNLKWTLMPRGWIYQNMVLVAQIGYEESQGFDVASNLIVSKRFEDLMRKMNEDIFRGNAKPYNFLAAAAIPNFTRALQTTARNQTLVNEAQIACALERYRLAHGQYPETLDALTPHFIEKLPHDIIGGPPSQGSGATSQPLHYRRTDDGKFLLYSIGWNETDDGGQESPSNQNGGIDFTKGDWVWQYPLIH